METWCASSGLPRPGGLAMQLWKGVEHIAYESLHSPFVVALGQGTLSKTAFQHYIAQDASYLQFFARAYALALSKCDPAVVNDEHYQQIGRMLRGVHEELRMHRKYAESWGVDLEAVVPSPATRAYTDFLMEVAEDHTTGLPEVLAAMAPCARLYAFLGCSLAKAFPDADHAYSGWIKMYSSREYLTLPPTKEDIIETVAAATKSDIGNLQRLYTRAMQLEVDFFCAHPSTPSPRSLKLVAVDFDDTCTTKDTTGTLMAAAVDAQSQAAGPVRRMAVFEELTAVTSRLSQDYMARLSHLLDLTLPKVAASTESGYDEAGLSAFLGSLSDFDEEMNGTVEAAGVLAGLSPTQLTAAAAAVELQPGCRGTLQRLLATRTPLRVVSVNWSAAFVAAALGLPLPPTTDVAVAAADLATAGVSSGMVVANQLEVGPLGTTTGRIKRGVQCARDKVAAFEAMVAGCGVAGGGAGHGVTVYIGDSTSDLGAMLKADFGIVIGQNKTLRRVAAAFGVRLAPLVSAPLSGPAPRGVLYEAGGWDEVAAFLLGPTNYEAYPYKGEMNQLRQGWATAGHNTPAQAPAQAVTAGKAGGAVAVPRVLTVAGSDSGGGAGIQADLKAVLANGAFGMSAVTALTAQNTHGVARVHVPPHDMLVAQLEAVLGDLGADAVKTGMLPDAATVEVVADVLSRYPVPHLVVDPVMISTSGHGLAGEGVADALVRHLLPLATLVTPNLPEASALLGGRAVSSLEDMEDAARELVDSGVCRAVLVKGGHLVGDTRNMEGAEVPAVVTDVFYDGREAVRLSSPTVVTGNTHGTGCTLAAAIASHLARGLPLLPAIQAARQYLHTALRRSTRLALGSGCQHPFNHGWMVADWQAEAGMGGARVDARAVRDAMRLYAVTDPGLNTKMGRTLAQAVRDAIQGGATIVQVRHKDCDGGEFLREAREAAAVCAAARVPLVINDRVDVALALGPDVGVHVGQSDIPAAVVRALLGPGRMLGVSVKTVEEAERAIRDGANYLGCGAVYATGTKDSSVIGVQGLAAVCKAAAPVPVVAIGGVGLTNAEEMVRDGGAAGIAVVSAIFGQEDAVGAAKQLRAAMDKALGQAAV